MFAVVTPLYLAVPFETFESFFQERFVQEAVKLCNMTEMDIARELVEMGVPKEDIVLGLHPPYKRPYTGYGVA